ncbi:MAG: phosphoribosyltransferase [Pseudomonadota bacterium]
MRIQLPFRDRDQAGHALAERLAERTWPSPVVLALPRGGVPVARVVADRLACPLDVVLVRKIGAPFHAELAIAAVVEGDPPTVVHNPEAARIEAHDPDYLEDARARAVREIERRRAAYLGDRVPIDVRGKTAILVDDGLATGTTMRAAILAMREREAARVVVAVPVAPPDTADEMRGLADNVVCLAEPASFAAVGQFYDDFHQLDDDEVVRLLQEPDAPPT